MVTKSKKQFQWYPNSMISSYIADALTALDTKVNIVESSFLY